MLRKLCAVAMLVAGSGFTSLPASAAPVVAGDYYEDVAPEKTCTENFCHLLFSVFPDSTAGRFVTITEISCSVRSPDDILEAIVQVTDNGQNPRRSHYFHPDRQGNTLSFSEPLNFKVAGGPPRAIKAVFVGPIAGTWVANCTIVGRITSN